MTRPFAPTCSNRWRWARPGTTTRSGHPEGHARGHTRDLVGYRPARLIDPSVPYSAGMLYSTIGDLARWATGLFVEGGLFRDPETLARMTTPGLESGSYGYGVGVRTRNVERDPEVRVIEHTGGIFGFSSWLRVFPDHGRLIVLLDNTSSDLGPLVEGLTNLPVGRRGRAPETVDRRTAAADRRGGRSRGGDVQVPTTGGARDRRITTTPPARS